MVRPFRLASLAALLSMTIACGGRADPHTAASQTAFGVRMAEKGLWSEAIFRFQQAERLAGGSDPEVLNNLAVASEALGRFEDALSYYRRALEQAPGNRDLKANYDRFVSFYESYRARAEEAPAAPAAGATDPPATPEAPPASPSEAPPEPPASEPEGVTAAPAPSVAAHPPADPVAAPGRTQP
jgi:tetratricopeptide (TPR) repeat protein